MPGARGEFETFLTLRLADQSPGLAEAHDELYPVRVGEAIPLSLTLLYPFVPRDSLASTHVAALSAFFASREAFAFSLTRVAESPRGMYAVPEPDEDLRATMRSLWALFPDYPPYGRVGGDPPPHASLAQLNDDNRDVVRAAVNERVEGLLPARFDARSATLMEEHAPDEWRVRASFALGA